MGQKESFCPIFFTIGAKDDTIEESVCERGIVLPDSLKCYVCNKDIQSRKDLVVTNRAFARFLTFHQDCYNKALRAGTLLGRPVNTTASDIGLAIIWLLALAFYIYTRKLLLLAVLIGSPIYRFIVWWGFERQLKK